MNPSTARLKEVVLVEGDEVDSVAAGIAHGHFTGHSGGGSDHDYQCEECPFEIRDGFVESGGSIAVLAEGS